MLRWVGVAPASEHDSPHTEEEIRVLLRHSRAFGELTLSEHRLIDAAFAFDNIVSRQIMVPRMDVIFIDAGQPFEEAIRMAAAGEIPLGRLVTKDVPMNEVQSVMEEISAGGETMKVLVRCAT